MRLLRRPAHLINRVTSDSIDELPSDALDGVVRRQLYVGDALEDVDASIGQPLHEEFAAFACVGLLEVTTTVATALDDVGGLAPLGQQTGPPTTAVPSSGLEFGNVALATGLSAAVAGFFALGVLQLSSLLAGGSSSGTVGGVGEEVCAGHGLPIVGHVELIAEIGQIPPVSTAEDLADAECVLLEQFEFQAIDYDTVVRALVEDVEHGVEKDPLNAIRPLLLDGSLAVETDEDMFNKRHNVTVADARQDLLGVLVQDGLLLFRLDRLGLTVLSLLHKFVVIRVRYYGWYLDVAFPGCYDSGVRQEYRGEGYPRGGGGREEATNSTTAGHGWTVCAIKK